MSRHDNSKKRREKREHKHDVQRKASQGTRTGIHKDWRAWVVVGLMLGAMVVYVMSLDESFGPAPQPVEEAPMESAD